jgi:hypothetical protein
LEWLGRWKEEGGRGKGVGEWTHGIVGNVKTTRVHFCRGRIDKSRY